MREVVIASAARTPIGNFGGSLTPFGAVDLGAIAAGEAIKRAGIQGDAIDQVIMGSVLTAAHGQNVARQVAIKAGLPDTVPAMTLNMVCGSGLRAVSLAAQVIMTGESDIVLAGGSESMSNAVYALKKARYGYRMGNDQLVDTMISDGLWDIYNDYHMGITAENIAEQWGITREEQDEFAAESQRRAVAAIEAGYFAEEIVPVTIPQRKGDPVVFAQDEFPRAGTTAEKLAKLRPAFRKDGGTVTAGNASGINDGAAMLVVMSREKADQLGIKPLAKVISFGSAGVDPKIMGYGPVPASRAALKMAGLTIEDIDLVEANEAFAAQSIAVVRDLGLDLSKTNVSGGAIALGHPIGATGGKILATLIYSLKAQKKEIGMVSACIGGGQGVAMVVRNL